MYAYVYAFVFYVGVCVSVGGSVCVCLCVIELFDDEHFVVMFSLVGNQNELLRQPGPFTPVLE